MAGSYSHAVTADGRLRNPRMMATMIEHNTGDVYEALEEMYGMIWFLADGYADRVERARQNYQQGIAMSPGVQP